MARKRKDMLMEYVDKLVAEKDLSNLDKEVLNQMKKDLYERLEDRVNAVILEKMPPEKLEEWNQMLDNSSDEEMQQFCLDNVPDMEQAIANELLSFRNTYLNL